MHSLGGPTYVHQSSEAWTNNTYNCYTELSSKPPSSSRACNGLECSCLHKLPPLIVVLIAPANKQHRVNSEPVHNIYRLLLHPFDSLFPRTSWVNQYQKAKTSLDLNEEIDDGILGCCGISWTICKQSAPLSSQTTTPTLHHSIFTDQMLFLTPNSVKALKAVHIDVPNIY